MGLHQVADEGEVVVREVISQTEQTLLGVMMIIIMLGMGASMTFKDFRLALRTPRAILIGFSSQYVFMPFIAFSLAWVLGLSPLVAAGLILVGCAPGGTTSNIFAYFSKGMLSLSIVMTVCSTIAAAIMVPIIFKLYTGLLGAATGEEAATIPLGDLATVLVVLLIPVAIGMWTRRKNANVGAMFELIGSLTGVAVIIFLIVTWVPKNFDLLLEASPNVYIASIGLGLCGFLIGYWFSRGLRLNKMKARTISLETGIQNAPLIVFIIALVFAPAEANEAILIVALYMLFIVLTSTMITLFYRARSKREELARDQAKVEAGNTAST